MNKKEFLDVLQAAILSYAGESETYMVINLGLDSKAVALGAKLSKKLKEHELK